MKRYAKRKKEAPARDPLVALRAELDRELAVLAVSGLRELQQKIRRRSKAKLSDRDVRSAIDEGRL